MLKIEENDLKNKSLFQLPVRRGCHGDGCMCLGTCMDIVGYVDRNEYENIINKGGTLMDCIRLYRTTPDNIDNLESNEIFVFGSNLSGIHGKGAAKTAHKKFGAIWGKEFGLQGNSFAIPTVNKSISDSLSIGEIRVYVDKFIKLAVFSEKIFLVTEIGCGLAGYTVDEIAPLFTEAINYYNIHLPQRFWDVILKKQKHNDKIPNIKFAVDELLKQERIWVLNEIEKELKKTGVEINPEIGLKLINRIDL